MPQNAHNGHLSSRKNSFRTSNMLSYLIDGFRTNTTLRLRLKAYLNGLQKTRNIFLHLPRIYRLRLMIYISVPHLPILPGRNLSHFVTSLGDTTTEVEWGDEWFSRGWTLQELLAPRVLNFYTSG
ncbi:hypothetical protein BDZ94DRAFT_1267562 [Collybia nuda]|uniref:Uncharacterized protein n=1 Tax=Collybia nuda TaxID=64659 RepID=A0A9P5Y1X5_9AGAR|nr:hypothetical protein BDZ94DRAFT_1267562 [Collybia nuda]